MTTQKTFKRRIRARATKTGESYTAARHHLVSRAERPGVPPAADPPLDTRALAGVSEDALVERTGRPLAAWFEALDAWPATDRSHTEIARWLVQEHGIDGWWSQTVTVAFERARGRRVLHQTAAGFSVGATRTVAAGADQVRGMFTDPRERARWLPDAPIEVHAAYRGRRGRFDWMAPPSKVWLDLVPKDDGRTTVTVTHEQLPDGAAAASMKQLWRDALGRLRDVLATA